MVCLTFGIAEPAAARHSPGVSADAPESPPASGGARFHANIVTWLDVLHRRDRKVNPNPVAYIEGVVTRSAINRWRDGSDPSLTNALAFVANVGIPLETAVAGVEPRYDAKVQEWTLARNDGLTSNSVQAEGVTLAPSQVDSETAQHAQEGEPMSDARYTRAMHALVDLLTRDPWHSAAFRYLSNAVDQHDMDRLQQSSVDRDTG
jgi:hypothetical protein